jgi:hypothetical protein
LVVPILRHELAADGQIENESPKTGDGIRRVGDVLEVSQQPLLVHRRSASARIALS